MVKKTPGEVEVTPTVTEEITPVVEEVTPATAESQYATLQTELTELKGKYEQADKGLRSAQATLTQKDRLLKEREDIRGEIDTLKSMVKYLAVQPSSGEDADDLETMAKRKAPDIDAKFKELEDRENARKYQDRLQETVSGYESRVNALGLTQENESYWEIKKLVTSGHPDDLRIADIKLKKLEKESAPVDNKPADEKDKVILELQAKVEKLEKIASGELDSETGIPSGSIKGVPTKVGDFRKWVQENPDEYREKKTEVDEMFKKGLIK